MFAQIDISRREATELLDQAKRADLGQFFTPYTIARFMASLFHVNGKSHISLLDAGAGIGSLSVAFLEQFATAPRTKLEIVAYELDSAVSSVLKVNLKEYCEHFSGSNITSEVLEGDFIREGVIRYLTAKYKPVDYAILNPPYRKINSDSDHRLLLRKVGIETVNLYAAFVALSILFLKSEGELVAIIPRSFCNGPYFKPFRAFLLARTALKQIHIFTARDKAFKEDSVLQENIIIHLVKDVEQANVKISSSSGDDFSDYSAFEVPFHRIVSPNDPEQFIHIPTTEENLYKTSFDNFSYTLSDLGIEVSTGPVVDFRVKEFLRKESDNDTAPLLYPAHFGDKHINWPKPNFRKSNALVIAPETKKQFFPAGCYTLVRRFSSKEEKRRIVARIVTPSDLPGDLVGFENHLNVFHQGKTGLSVELALGLAVYLNSSLIDQYFRQFNGHTQVNVTDLRLLKYPSKPVLIELGIWAKHMQCFDQAIIDSKISTLI
jgi:adenine-specific DNA-methyltransferase